jgi:hypothetical protein
MMKPCLKRLPEKWRPIKGYSGKYEISSWGRVKSLKRLSFDGRTLQERFLRPGKTNGYYYVGLYNIASNQSKRTIIPIHKLVALAFCRNRFGNLFVNHLDRNKLNNYCKNLEWCNQRENNSHSTRNRKTKSSKYTGVYWRKSQKMWTAAIYIDRKVYNLGGFRTERQASNAYKASLKEHKLINKYS